MVVLIHGGYWRAVWTKRLMHELAGAIADLGFAVWNIEYRRTGLGGGGGGWPATFADVAAAVDHLAEIDGVDTGQVTTCGHSAGGHLALWLAARHRLPADAPGASPAVAVSHGISLAGVVDLDVAARADLGAGAVAALLGAPSDHPDRYRLGSPAALLPLGVRQTLIHGDRDATVPLSLSEGYARTAEAAGDTVALRVVPGADHRSVIRAGGPSWAALRDALLPGSG